MPFQNPAEPVSPLMNSCDRKIFNASLEILVSHDIVAIKAQTGFR
jgi:hypothetical protein